MTHCYLEVKENLYYWYMEAPIDGDPTNPDTKYTDNIGYENSSEAIKEMKRVKEDYNL